MADLPTGTVTFLFTDIAGSTQLWERHPQAMPAALARHDALMRQAVEAHGGAVFKLVGDAVCAAFATAVDALDSALAAQRALYAESWDAVGALRVRMALHTGAAQERDGDYFGQPLNRVARLLATGHGGQTLLSAATCELLRGRLPAGVALHDLGQHRLKDLTRPEQIFQLVIPDLPATFPPLKTLDTHPTNLPAQPTALIGREQEVAAACAMLRKSDVRLLTLIGPGGTGKTRLGLQIAAELLDDFVDGVYFVALAPISDPALVISAIAATLGVKEAGGQPLLETLTTALHDKQRLLLLDNFEQVVAAAPFVAELLAAAPHLKVLVTSRAALHLSGEHEFAVPPLGLPDRTRLPALEQLTQYEAVRLFIERAQAVQATFVVTNANAPAVAEICHQLDGLPLAIELAAARVKLFPPQALLARLGNRLKLLTGGARDLPQRQQTIRDAIDWSYDLLDPAEQALFTRLGVFVGGWTLEAAEAVCGADRELPIDVIDGIASLLDKSLLRQEAEASGESRFTMLETIREYALERLAANGELEALRQWHAEHFVALAEAAEPELEGANQIAWLQRLASEHDNLRAAFAWICARPGTIEMSLRFTGALYGFWERRRYLSEARAWLERALARPGGPPAARTKALFCLAQIAEHLDEYAWAITLFSESLANFEESDDHIGVARALLNQGRVLSSHGDYHRAGRLLEQSLTYFRELGDRADVSMALLSLGDLALLQGSLEQARASLEEGKLISQDLGLTAREASATMSLRRAAHAAGDDIQASRLLTESLALFRAVGDQSYAGGLLLGFAQSAHRLGDDQHATTLYRESLILLREVGTQADISACLAGLARAAMSEGNLQRAGRLTEAAEALRAAMSAPRPPVFSAEYARDHVAGRTELNVGVMETALAAGRALTLEQAISYALEPTPEVTPPTPPPVTPPPIPSINTYPAGLTEREVEVLRLLAQGLSYAEIAAQLVISPRTVNRHLTVIYSKLDVTSRHAATRLAIDHHLV
jgi:predicted ATPase/class 3 adenylate cyclase/DNA-binding NarL/FixJ family response regulator